MDYLFRGLAREKRVRIMGVDAKNAIANICRAHQTLPLTTMAFAKFLLAGTMIGCLEKSSQGITMQIHSDGPIKMLFMQATSNGLIRGYVGNEKADLALDESNYKLENLVGLNGILSVTKTIENGNDFTSDVILSKSDIVQDIAYYFFTSEQIPTIINLQVELDDQGEISCAKGYLIQLLTGYTNEDIEYLENIKIGKINDLEEDIKSMFEDFEKLEEIKVREVCDCSKEKFANGLATLDNKEIEKLAEDESIETVCQFCNKSYVFTKEELLDIINKKEK